MEERAGLMPQMKLSHSWKLPPTWRLHGWAFPQTSGGRCLAVVSMSYPSYPGSAAKAGRAGRFHRW